jgi:hypothetical protein
MARGANVHALVFAVCAACTLWLIAQNTILLTLLPQAWVPALLQGVKWITQAAVTLGVQLFLVPLAFGLGWLVSRSPAGAARTREAARE